MHHVHFVPQAVPASSSKLIPETAQQMLRITRAYLACFDAWEATEILRGSGK
jgi:hypothetical protein